MDSCVGQALILGIGAIMFAGRSLSARRRNESTRDNTSKQRNTAVDDLTHGVYANLVKVK